MKKIKVLETKSIELNKKSKKNSIEFKDINQTETNYYMETQSFEKKINLLKSQAFPYLMETPGLKNELNDVKSIKDQIKEIINYKKNENALLLKEIDQYNKGNNNFFTEIKKINSSITDMSVNLN